MEIKIFSTKGDLVNQTISNSDGYFSIDLKDFGAYSLSAEKQGYVSFKREIKVLEGQLHVEDSVTLDNFVNINTNKPIEENINEIH